VDVFVGGAETNLAGAKFQRQYRLEHAQAPRQETLGLGNVDMQL